MSSSIGSKHHAYSRKEKSLGLLCSNFINMYNRDGIEFVGLDEAASRLGVERRRIYDIVNVLESVGVLSRKAKNQYSWKGFAGIPQALEELRDEALREKSGNSLVSSDDCLKVLDDDEDEVHLDQSGDERRQSKSSPNSDLEAPPFCGLSSRIKTDNRREKSLGLLTQNFLKLFLTTNVDMVSLDEAANLLLGDVHGSSQMRTKVRRLYDIANVLASMNLIEKTHQTVSRKPAYRWLGFKGMSYSDAVLTSRSPNPLQPKKRDFGTDITNMEIIKRSKLSSSVDEKPIKVQMKHVDSLAQKDCTQMQEQQQKTKDYVFGPFRPVGLQDTQRKGVKSNQEWETLASSYRPQYHNQALSDLFAHYMEAWKSWYVEVAQGSNLSRKAIHLPL